MGLRGRVGWKGCFPNVFLKDVWNFKRVILLVKKRIAGKKDKLRLLESTLL